MAMVASNVNVSTQRLISRPDIKSPDELKGKRVGVTAFGSNTHSVLLMLLKRWSMKPEDLNILQIGPSPTMVLSLEKGLLDAAILTSPSDFIAIDRGNRVLADLADLQIYSLQSTVTTTRDYLKTSEDQATRFIKGYSEGIAFIKKNKAQSIEVLQKGLRLEHSQAAIWTEPTASTPASIWTRCLTFPFRGSKHCSISSRTSCPKLKASIRKVLSTVESYGNWRTAASLPSLTNSVLAGFTRLPQISAKSMEWQIS
jgi:NMT1/THI5 like